MTKHTTSDFRRGPYQSHQLSSEKMQRVRKIATLLDSHFVIPGTSIRFGWDSIIGLIPGVGDLTTLAFSLLIIHAALEANVPSSVILRMVSNIAIDTVVGAVPIAGDLFDLAWKSNRRNADLLAQYTEAPTQVKRRSRLWIAGFILLIGFALVGFAFSVVKLGLWVTQSRV